MKVRTQDKVTEIIKEAYQRGFNAGHAAGLRDKAKELAREIEKINFTLVKRED